MLTFPAIILLCLGGVPLRIANMQFANLFPKNRSTVITFYSGAFSSSAVLFVVLKYGYDAGLSFNVTCSSLVLVSCLMIPFTLFALPADQVKEQKEEEEDRRLFKYGVHNLALSTVTLEKFKPLKTPVFERKTESKAVNEVVTPGVDPGVKTNPLILYTHPHFMSLDVSVFSNEFSKNKDSEADSVSESTSECGSSNPSSLEVSKALPKANRPPSTDSQVSVSSSDSTDPDIPLSMSMLSLPFTLHQYWFSWLLTYMIMYVGTMSLWLDRVTQDPSVSDNFTKIFGVVQVLALVLAPMAGCLMDYQVNQANQESDPFKRRLARIQSGFWPMMFTTSTLAGILVCRFFNTTSAVYVSILFITLLRSFLVAVGSAYLRIRYDIRLNSLN